MVVRHSYARDLKRLYPHYNNLTLKLKNEEVLFDIHFLAYPGMDYQHFLDNPELIELIKAENPDVVVIIFGGN